MQFFRSALFPATGEPPVLVSATFKFVPLSVLFAEKCLFNFVYRHCKIFTRSLLLEQFSHHRERWKLDDIGMTTRTGRQRGAIGRVSLRYVQDRTLSHASTSMRVPKNFSLRKNLHIYGSATLARVALMFSNVRGLSRDRNLKTNCRNCAKNCIETASHVEHSKAFPVRLHFARI